MKKNRNESKTLIHKPMKTDYLKSKKLIVILKKYKMLKDSKLLDAFTLNYEIFTNVKVLINEKERVITLEYWLPVEIENKIIAAMKSCGIKKMKNKMPYDFIETLLDSLAHPVYRCIAKDKGWQLSWVKINKTVLEGDLQERDTVIRVKIHPLSQKEQQARIRKSIFDNYVAFKTAKMNKEELLKYLYEEDPDKESPAEKEGIKAVAVIIKQLQKENIIDADCNTADSETKLQKYIRNEAGYLADARAKATRVCRDKSCEKRFLRVTSKQVYCSNACRNRDCRARKAAKSA